MNVTRKHFVNTEDSKSNSTIQLEFSEPTVQILAPTYDSISNSYPSIEQYYLRKRSTSNEDQRIANEEENSTKKQKNNNDHLAFSENARNQQIFSLSDSNEGPQQNEIISKRSVSIQNVTEPNFDWLKDFMRQSLDTIRDTVVQACLTALSTRSIVPFDSNTLTHDMNVNNHLTRHVQSEHTLVSHQTDDSWENHQLEFASPRQRRRWQKNEFLLIQNRLDGGDVAGEKQRIHHRARKSPYPMCKNALRIPVNDIRVPWSYEWLQYEPTIFTAEEVYLNPGADPDLLKSSSMISLHFNTIDGAVDRRSVYRHYDLNEQNGLPLNPIGRTGLQGRGILLRWGPNIYHYIMICRWKRDIHGRIILHPSNGKRILEILLEIQANGYETSDFILTGGLRMLGSPFPPQLQDRLKRFLIHTGVTFHNKPNISTSLLALNQLFEQTPIPWKGAYFDDARNTDNAWIELSIEYFLDDDDYQSTACIPSMSSEQLIHLEQPRFIWKDVQRTITIGPRTHYRLLRNLASKLDAYF